MKILFVFLAAAFLCACSEWFECGADESGNFGNKIPMVSHFRFSMELIYQADSSSGHSRAFGKFYTKDRLDLYEDSSFTYSRVWERFEDSSKMKFRLDTLEHVTGVFRIQRAYFQKWHRFVFEGDSVRKRDFFATEDGNVVVGDFVAEPHEVNADSILLDVDDADSCFTLAMWVRDDGDIGPSCSDPYKQSTRIFCANAEIRDSARVGMSRVKW